MSDQEQRHEMHADATRVSQAHPTEVGTDWSAWRTLHLPMFRNLLVADLVSDSGTFMQGVGAAWLMVSQGAGPLLVALTQTASAFPFFLLALPAGALGDIFDRRKLILTTEIWMFSVAMVLAVLTMLTGRDLDGTTRVVRCTPSLHARNKPSRSLRRGRCSLEQRETRSFRSRGRSHFHRARSPRSGGTVIVVRCAR